jgi:hypothetical protein
MEFDDYTGDKELYKAKGMTEGYVTQEVQDSLYSW